MSHDRYAIMAMAVVAVLLFSYIVYDIGDDDNPGKYNAGDYATYSLAMEYTDTVSDYGIGPFFVEDTDVELAFTESGTAKSEITSIDKNGFTFTNSASSVGTVLIPEPLDLGLFVDFNGYIFSNTYSENVSKYVWINSYELDGFEITETLYADSHTTLIGADISHLEAYVAWESETYSDSCNYDYAVEDNKVTAVTVSTQSIYTYTSSENRLIDDYDPEYDFQLISESLGYPVLVNRTISAGEDFHSTGY